MLHGGATRGGVTMVARLDVAPPTHIHNLHDSVQNNQTNDMEANRKKSRQDAWVWLLTQIGGSLFIAYMLTQREGEGVTVVVVTFFSITLLLTASLKVYSLSIIGRVMMMADKGELPNPSSHKATAVADKARIHRRDRVKWPVFIGLTVDTFFCALFFAGGLGIPATFFMIGSVLEHVSEVRYRPQTFRDYVDVLVNGVEVSKTAEIGGDNE